MWHGGDRSLKHDVLIMLPQHCQNVTAPQQAADKGDAGGPGTLGQSMWKAAKGFSGAWESEQWTGALLQQQPPNKIFPHAELALVSDDCSFAPNRSAQKNESNIYTERERDNISSYKHVECVYKNDTESCSLDPDRNWTKHNVKPNGYQTLFCTSSISDFADQY